MKKSIILLLAIFFVLEVSAQKKQVVLDDFSTLGTFRAKGVTGLHPMNDGIHYTVLEGDGTRIVKYSYTSGQEVGVVVDMAKLKKSPIQNMEGYAFSADETKVLVYVNAEKIFRHSFRADYYVIDVARREIEALSPDGKQQEATFSPDGFNVAYVRNNNIFIKKLRFATESAITADGEQNKIINGLPDWVYEEEFSFTRAFEWSPNNEELAYIKFDESGVQEFSFSQYKASNPAYDDFGLYPGTTRYKYPKAGEANSKVSVHVFNLRNRTTKRMDVGDLSDAYIPRIRFTQSADQLGVMKLNRQQSQLDLYLVNPSSGVGRVIFTDRNSKYVDESVFDQLQFLTDGKHFVYVGELDGYNHIHLFGMDGRKVRQITKGEWDVTDFYGYDAKNRLFYFQAAAKSPLRREVYSVRLDGTKQTCLTPNEGTNVADFSATYSHFISHFSNATTPTRVAVLNASGKQLRLVEENTPLADRLAGYDLARREFFTFTTTEGITLNGWMVKPLDFQPENKYPVVMTQYSGPNSQRVLDQWEMGWEQFLAAKGYVVVCVDGRGTGARGEEFRKATYMKLGKLESDDQIEAARYLSGLSFVDGARIGIWGWSYGGFMSALCLSRSDVFKVGIAVAPVTNWRFYDSAYTERYMRQPRENPSGYDNNSPLALAANLQGRLFLIHGSADDNVHLQNTMEYADRLIQAGKQFDMFIYPNRDHSIVGGRSRSHLYQMMFDYLEENL
jgi:dipeptidyl-peptidase 4